MNELTQYCYEGDWIYKSELEERLKNVKPKEFFNGWGLVGKCWTNKSLLVLRKGDRYKYVADAKYIRINDNGERFCIKR